MAPFVFLALAVFGLVSGAEASIDNSATATGTYQSQSYPSAPSTASVPVAPQVPSIGIVKSAGPIVDANSSGAVDAGDTITYSFVVSNLGNVSLSSLAVTDAKVGTVSCPQTTLAPGQTVTCTAAAYVLTQADINAGQVSNQATATAKTPSGTTISDLSDPTTAGPAANAQTVVTFTPKAEIGLVKTASLVDVNGNGVTDVGDKISYSFTVKNLGAVTLTSVGVTDPKVSGITCPQTTLTPGQSSVCTAPAVALTQVDIDNGQVSNQATASGTPPSGPAVTDLSDPTTSGPTANNPTVTTLVPQPAIGIVKPAGTLHDLNNNGQPDAGETVSYTFHVTNMGNVTLHNVAVADPHVTGIVCQTTTLAPGAGTDCAGADYIVTQADINAGKIDNQATATGLSPTGTSVLDASDPATPGTGSNAVTQTPLTQKPGIGLVKVAGAVIDANNDGIIDVGDQIHYTFAVTDMGNTTLTNVTVTDSKISGVTCVSTTLQPGQTTSCTGTFYIITQTDVDAGQVTNTASVTANPPSGPAVTDVSDPTTPGPTANTATVTSLSPTPAIGLVKQAGAPVDANHNGVIDAGDTIAYTFTVSNLGNLTLHNVTVTDNKVASITCPNTPLLPKDSFACTAPVYVLTQADINAGNVTNSATASGLPPTGPAVTDVSDPATPGPTANAPTVTNLTPAPAIGLVKSAGPIVDANNDGKVDAGDTVTYSFTVTNMGTVTLSAVGVSDPKVPGITCAASKLDPGVSTLCTGPAYVLTQADVDAGRLSNQATATGTPPVGPAVTDLSDETTAGAGPGKDNPTVVSIPQSPLVGLVKVAGPVVDANTNSIVDAGDTIAYTFTVSNLGNVTLSNVSVTDPKVSGITCLATTLAPAAQTTCTAPAYVLTQADINAGHVSNQATVSAKPPFGLNVTDNSDPATPGPTANAPTDVILQSNPVIGLVKTSNGVSDANNNGVTDAGDTISYNFTVKNLGNVTLNPITVTDAKVANIVCPAGGLVPGASVTCTGNPYVITQADMDTGSVANHALASGTTPGGQVVTDESDPVTSGPAAKGDTTTTLTGKAQITLAKADTLVGPMQPGSTITYKFTITNTGSVTVKNITLADTGATLSGGPLASLAPGASDTVTFTGSHVLTAADVSAGFYTNTATASGDPMPTGAPKTSATASVTTSLNFTAAMTLSKTGALANGPAVPPKAGDVVNYSFKVTNTGNSPLHNITIGDPLVAMNAATLQAQVALLQGVVAPDAGELMTASLNDNPHVSGAVAAAQRHAALAPLPPAHADLNVSRQLVRMSGNQGPLQSGEKIGFLYGLANTGDVPLTSISVAQPDGFAFGSGVSLLNPNEQDAASIIFTRDLTPEEALAGEVHSNAYILMKAQGREVMQQMADALPLSGIKSYDSFATASITPTTLATLAAGASYTFTAPYALKQADIDAGTIHNVATATAQDVSNQSLTQTASFDLPLQQKPDLGIVKTGTITFANGTSAQVGDVVTYHFAVTNLGNVTLSNVAVTDGTLTVIGSPIAALAPGVTNTSYTAQYVLTQADIDAGHHDNQATASGTPPTGPTVNALSDFADPKQHRKTVIPVTPNPAIALLKQVTGVTDTNANGRNDAGDVIHYKFTIKNTGNVTLSNVVVTDPLMPGAPTKPLDIVSGGPLTLAPGATDTTITGTYVIEQADMDRGHVDNTATVTGKAPDGTVVKDDSDPGVFTQNAPTIQPLVQVPQVGLYKAFNAGSGWTDTNHDGIIDAGDVLHFTFTVSNPGNVTLSNIKVVDTLAPNTVANSNPGQTLAPGTFDGTSFTFNYTVTKADEKAGKVQNSATVTADQINTTTAVTAVSVNGVPGSSNPGTTDVAIQPTPTIGLILNQPNYFDTNGDGVVDAGDTLTYPVWVKNTGAVTLTNIVVSDADTSVTINQPANLTLTPGQEDKTSVTATHVLTAADIAAGFFDTQALATGKTSPGAVNITDLSDPADYTKDAPTHFVIGATPRIAVKKSFGHFENASGATVALPVPGGSVVYTITVKNTGNVPFSDVTVAEVAGFTGTVTGAHPFTLAVGAEDATHFVVRQPVTNADIVNGSIKNQVSAVGTNSTSGNSPADLSDANSFTADNPTIVALQLNPALAVIKSFTVDDVNHNGANDTGDIIHYTFQVANIGNVDLTNVTLVDPGATLTGGPIASLKVGATDTTTFTAVHTVTAAELAKGAYPNQATATGTYGAGLTSPPALSDATSFSTNPPQPTITQLSIAKPVLTKVADRSQVKRGEVVAYTITASNLGAGPFQLADIMPPGFGYVGGSAKVNGTAVTPVANGQVLTFNALTPVSGKITLTLNLMASTTLSGGKFVNNARLIDPSTNQVLGVAQATVEVIPDAVFDCSDIIGRVFDDLNGNGYMDDGEPGLAGVRLVTLNGVLITTDAEGRYHVPCAAIPDSAIGGNYLLKLDPRTLPEGYKLTTENPRDVRVTRGKATVLNFGATKTHDVKVDVTGKAFVTDGIDLTPTWSNGLPKLCKILTKKRSALQIIYHQGGETGELAQARVDALEAEINATCDPGYALKITTNVAEGK